MTSRLAPLLLALAAGTAIAAAPARSPQPPAPDSRPRSVPAAPAVPAPDLETLRRGFLARLNEERAVARVRPLHLVPLLSRVAQARAEEIGAKGELPQAEESFRLFAQIQRRIFQAGYSAHGWTESFTSTGGDVAAVIAYFKEGDSYQAAMGADYRDLGVGISAFRGVPFYAFLFAWPETDFYARQVAGISDLGKVREQMLERVNAARRAAGRAPLKDDPRLDAAAQQHAEDMQARVYYDHRTPEGVTPRDRVQAAGYTASLVAENIAEGEFSVDEVMDGWMKSTDHRRNLLLPDIDNLGVGLAIGRYEDRLRLLWVQEFARQGL
ncbi:MAG TPA: CAP domain-containing protein [Thermoanaerobaculia bacterium]|nr:CAP domain-containing protein [Thermoanaerobaculia bacterium]